MCPGCRHARSRIWRRTSDRNFRAAEGTFIYVKCRACGLVYLHDRPVEAEVPRLYPSHYAPYTTMDPGPAAPSSRRERAVDRTDIVTLKPLRSTLSRGLRKVWRDTLPAALDAFYDSPTPGATLLDFGCGSAWFLNHARRRGWSTIGVDMSPDVLQEMRRHGHVAVPEATWSQAVADASVDAVRLNHVLEHLYDPDRVLRMLCTKMKPGAGLHLATPNPSGLSSVLFRSYWYSLEAPRHVMLYTPAQLRAWLPRLGFSDVRLVFELSAKDFTRSLGHVLHARAWIAHEAVARMDRGGPLNACAQILVHAAAIAGRPDRYHVFARKA